MARSIMAFIIFFVLFGAVFLVMDFMIFNSRGLPLIYNAL